MNDTLGPAVNTRGKIKLMILNLGLYMFAFDWLTSRMDTTSKAKLFIRDGMALDLNAVMDWTKDEDLQGLITVLGQITDGDPENELKNLISDATLSAVNEDRVIEILCESMDIRSSMQAFERIKAEYDDEVSSEKDLFPSEKLSDEDVDLNDDGDAVYQAQKDKEVLDDNIDF